MYATYNGWWLVSEKLSSSSSSSFVVVVRRSSFVARRCYPVRSFVAVVVDAFSLLVTCLCGCMWKVKNEQVTIQQTADDGNGCCVTGEQLLVCCESAATNDG